MISVDADHLRRMCAFVGWAATGVVRPSVIDDVNGDSDSWEDSGEGKERAAGDSDSDDAALLEETASLLWSKEAGTSIGVDDGTGRETHREQGQDRARDARRDPRGSAGVGGRGDAVDEDRDVRGIWATSEERRRTGEYLLSNMRIAGRGAMDGSRGRALGAAGTGGGDDLTRNSTGGWPQVEILEPKDGSDVLFAAFAAKQWRVRAVVRNFELGHDVGYACLYLDGAYKVDLCSGVAGT